MGAFAFVGVFEGCSVQMFTDGLFNNIPCHPYKITLIA